jgi:CTP synthase
MQAHLDRQIMDRLRLEPRQEPDVGPWQRMIETIMHPVDTVEIAVAGKYIELHDAYKSIYESLTHAGIAHEAAVKVRKVSAEQVAGEGPETLLRGVHGVLVPGGFGERGFEGKIRTIRHAREKGIPFFGICYGLQAAVVDFARHVAGIPDATTAEYAPDAKNAVVSLMEEQKAVADIGGTMRLGAFDCTLREGTLAHRAYGKRVISERHRHRYELNNAYRSRLAEAGLVMAGVNEKLDLVEIIELREHPWFVAVQFHPEFKTRPMEPHPLFRDFVGAALRHKRGTGPAARARAVADR